MSLSWKEWGKNDILFGIIVPVLIVLLIVGLSSLGSFFGYENLGFIIGITSGISEAILIVGIPMLLGLLWNRWAGGASGFLLGSIFALYWADSFHSWNNRGDISLLGYVVSAMLIGYMSGALNKSSKNFRRMVISAFTAGTIGGLLFFMIYQLSSMHLVYGVDGFLITLLPRMACGVIMPIIAKFFFWYGFDINLGR